MRYPRFPRILSLVLFIALVSGAATSSAKSSNWQDVQGTKFKAEPIEVLGPFALFRSGATKGRQILLRGLAPEECLRFYRETADRPVRAAVFADAKGEATVDLPGRVLLVQNGELVKADLKDRPEPELLVVLYGSHNDGESWKMLGNFGSIYRRLQEVYPGKVEFLYFGVRQSVIEHRNIATSLNMPWLVADPLDQHRITLLADFAPREGVTMLAISRDGAPVLAGNGGKFEDVVKFADGLGDLLGLMNPNNPRTWKDREHYYGVTRPTAFKAGSTGPMLIGNPLRAEGLRLRGVGKVVAQLAVAADGSVTSVTMLPEAQVPEAMVGPLVNALTKHATFLPAISDGEAVSGRYTLVVDVPPANAKAEAAAAWLSGDPVSEVMLNGWLVLKPIHLDEAEFVDVDHVDASGDLVMQALEVSSARVSRAKQLSAFSSNWFDAVGAGSVHPTVGEHVLVDGENLTWANATGVNGLIDLQAGVSSGDYVIGYAWTEFEVPVDCEAWLGIGSDDGLKIWHNGELVHENWIRRISRIDDDVVPLHLKQGKNQLLIKIQNVKGDWSFISRLRIRQR